MLSKRFKVTVPLYGIRSEQSINKIGVGVNFLAHGEMHNAMTDMVTTYFNIIDMVERCAAGIPFGLLEPQNVIDIMYRIETTLSHYENISTGEHHNPMAGEKDGTFNVEFATDLDDLCQSLSETYANRIRKHKLSQHSLEKELKSVPISNTGIKYGGSSIGFDKTSTDTSTEQLELEELLQERTRRLINESFK